MGDVITNRLTNQNSFFHMAEDEKEAAPGTTVSTSAKFAKLASNELLGGKALKKYAF